MFLRHKSFFMKLLAAYLLLCSGFYFFQDLFFFHPEVLAANYPFAKLQKHVEKQIQLDEKTLIDIVQFTPADSLPKGVVLYFHGNRQNIERYARYAPLFTDSGYECWMVDYPGYGKSTDNPTTQNMQQMAVELYKMARAKYDKNKITIYGKSLGTGVAAYLASVRDCKQLILETPYFSMGTLAQRYTPVLPSALLLKMDLTTGDYFKDIPAPITVFHGLQDEVIPFTNALKLAARMKKGDQFIAIPKGHHNDLPADDLFKKKLGSLL